MYSQRQQASNMSSHQACIRTLQCFSIRIIIRVQRFLVTKCVLFEQPGKLWKMKPPVRTCTYVRTVRQKKKVSVLLSTVEYSNSTFCNINSRNNIACASVCDREVSEKLSALRKRRLSTRYSISRGMGL